MVYIHIPEALTEEEQMLMAKYAKLKKKVRKLRFVEILLTGNIFFVEKATSSVEDQAGTWEAADSEATERRSWCPRGGEEAY